MVATTPEKRSELLRKLTEATSDWEASPYYLEQEELFDLERFLIDHGARDLLQELEQTYGRPLNQKFWSSSLAYHKLKRARQAVKDQEARQDDKRSRYLEAVEESKREWQSWLKEWTHNQRRRQMRLVHPRHDAPSNRD